jgi:uncharacterized membrane protein
MDETTGAPMPPPPASPTPPVPAGVDRPGPASDTSKLLAALGYLLGVVAIIALLIEPYKDEKFVKFHAIQALGLWVVGVVAGVVPVIGWIVSIAVFVVVIIGLIKAFQGQYWEVPGVYGVVKGFIGE